MFSSKIYLENVGGEGIKMCYQQTIRLTLLCIYTTNAIPQIYGTVKVMFGVIKIEQ